LSDAREFWEAVEVLADRVASELDADVLLYNGDIDARWAVDENLIDACGSMGRRTNAVLVLVTYGGNPHVAYRIARCLQQCYRKLTIYIPGICMSAGTLITLGAHEIVMSAHGRLGPLDVQVYKPDELYEAGSGLDVMEAVDSLRSKTIAMFRATLLDLKLGSSGQITLKTAMENASSLTAGIFAPIYQQIDPSRLGEIARQMSIAEEYGARLGARSNNLKEDTLGQLVAGYPSHSFVIDRAEAEMLFHNVRRPTESESALADALADFAREPIEPERTTDPPLQPVMTFISSARKPEEEEGDEGQNGRRGAEGAGAQVGSPTEDPREELAADQSLTPNGEGQGSRPQPSSS